MTKGFLFPRPRRHTYYFLRQAKQFAAVYLDMEVDMSNVKQSRKRLLEEQGERVSYIAFLIQAISQVVQRYPESNSAVEHAWLPKMALYDRINAKFTLDKEIDGTRAVVAGLIPDADRQTLVELQKRINTYRDRSFHEIEEFAPIRKLQALPLGIGQWLYNIALSNFDRRAALQGTFCVTSLGHRPVQAFYPMISATLCFGMGGIEDKPVVVGGEIQVRPMMRLSLGFDHRAIDGAMAADILAEVKQVMEQAKA